MNDTPKTKGKPAAVTTLGGHKMPGAKPVGTRQAGMPRAIQGTIKAEGRPSALPMSTKRNITAFTSPSIVKQWDEDASGVRALASGDNVITMFEEIGEDFWTGGGVTAKRVAAQLRAIGDRAVEAHINSFGGDMFEGIAIYNVLREHPQPVTIKVMGMAASAASIIAMAGDTIEIGAASFLMIHNCEVSAGGNRHAMTEVAAFLKPFDEAMAGVYAERTGLSVAECAKMMDAETFMSGSSAIALGFANSLLPADQITIDEKVKAEDHRVNKLRGMERTLIQAGLSREEARANIEDLRSKRDAASDPAAKRDAGGELLSPLAELLATCKI